MPHWREFASDGTYEQAYAQTNNTYIVRKEYDLRFHCTWKRIGIYHIDFIHELFFHLIIFFIK